MAMTIEAFNKMMGVNTTPIILNNGKPFLKLYKNSYATLNEYDKMLRFGSDSEIEDSIINFLDATGFSCDDSGYRYLKYIFFSCVKRMYLPTRIGALYEDCRKTFGVSERCVDLCIAKAVYNAVLAGKLVKINSIFSLELYNKYDKPTNAKFIATIANRFIYYKKYGIDLHYRA